MVDSLDELESSLPVCGKDFPNFEMLDAKDCFRSEQGYPEFSVQEEAGQLRGAECQEKMTGFFEEDRSFS